MAYAAQQHAVKHYRLITPIQHVKNPAMQARFTLFLPLSMSLLSIVSMALSSCYHSGLDLSSRTMLACVRHHVRLNLNSESVNVVALSLSSL